MDYELKSFREEVLRQKDIAIEKALEMIGLQAQGYAQEELSKPKKHADGTVHPNVDTGRLRNSITHDIEDKNTAVIGTNVKYAPYVEFGTSKSQPYPYLKPAVNEHIREYKQIVKNCLQG